jgi:hypothetical protein
MSIDLKGWGRISGEQVVVSATLDYSLNPTLESQVDAAEGAAISVTGVTLTDLTVRHVDGTLIGTEPTATVTAVVAAIQPGEDERLVTVNTPSSLDSTIRIYGWGVLGEPGLMDAGSSTVTPGAAGVLERWWQNTNHTGTPVVTQIVPTPLVLVPSDGDLPPGVSNENLSVRWTGKLVFPSTGGYRFRVIISDWGDLYLENKLVLQVTNENQGTRDSGTFQYTAAQEIDFWASMVEQGSTDREFSLWWITPGTTTWVKIPASAFKQADITAPPSPIAKPQAHHYVEYVNRYEDQP